MTDADVSRLLGARWRELVVASRSHQSRPHLIVVGDESGEAREMTEMEIAEAEREHEAVRVRQKFMCGYDFPTFRAVYGLSASETKRALAAGLPHQLGGAGIVVHRDECRAWLDAHRAEISDPKPAGARAAKSKPRSVAAAIEAAPTMSDVEAALWSCLEELRAMQIERTRPTPTKPAPPRREPAFVEYSEPRLVRMHYR